MNPIGKPFTFLLGLAALCLTLTVALAANQAKSAPSSQAKASGPVRTRVNVPPLPNVGFAPVRPMDPRIRSLEVEPCA